MLILIFNLHSSSFDSGERKELKAEEELFRHSVKSTPWSFETYEFESDGRGFQRILSLNIHHDLVLLEAIACDLSRGMSQLVS